MCDDPPCDPCDDCDEYTSKIPLKSCRGFRAWGKNPYFILMPGYILVLEGEEDGEEIRAEVIVSKKRKRIYVPGLGRIKTSVVLEKEWVGGDLVEVSWNYFAICNRTNAVYYFGEKVDVCDDGLEPDSRWNSYSCNGEEPEHPGQWIVGENGAMPGIIMPGTFLLGAKYCQEQAPSDDPEEAAVDRGFNEAQHDYWEVDAGTFKNCVEVRDTNPAEGICDPEDGDLKIYCRGIGLVQDEELELTCFGFSCGDDGDDDDDDDDNYDDYDEYNSWIRPDGFKLWTF